MLGYGSDTLDPDFDFFKQQIHPDDLTKVMEIVEAHRQGKTPKTDFEYRLINAYGQITWVRLRAGVAESDENGLPKRIVGTLTDITASKVTEESLLTQANELVERNKELERFNRATIGRELDMIELKKQVNDLALKLGLQPPYDLSFLEASSLPLKPSGDIA
jgi:PAS domain S-box-containing protein